MLGLKKFQGFLIFSNEKGMFFRRISNPAEGQLSLDNNSTQNGRFCEQR